MVEVKLKRKYRTHLKDWYAKRCGFGTDDQNKAKHKVAGPKTYVREDHVLVMGPTGKTHMEHR